MNQNKEEMFEMTGKVIKKHEGFFTIKLENGHEIAAHISGKMRRNKIKILLGDNVSVEISPYDLSKGRIKLRLK